MPAALQAVLVGPSTAGPEQLACLDDCRLSGSLADLVDKVVQKAQVDIHLHVLAGGILWQRSSPRLLRPTAGRALAVRVA